MAWCGSFVLARYLETQFVFTRFQQHLAQVPKLNGNLLVIQILFITYRLIIQQYLDIA